MTQVRGTGETIHWRRTGSSAATGRCSRSGTPAPARAAGRPGVVVAFKDIEEQRAAEQGLREREAILAKVGQPVWVTDAAGYFHYANPAALAALGYDDPSDLVGKPRARCRPLQVPGRHAVPRGRLPARPGRGARGGSSRSPTTGSSTRTARSCASRTRSAPFELPDGLGSVTAFTDVEEQSARRGSRASATWRRRGRRSCGSPAGGSSRRPTRRARSSSATCTTARSSSSSARCCSCRLPSARRTTDPDGARELRAQAIELATAGVDELRRLAAGIHPGDPHRPRARASGGGARVAAAARRVVVDAALDVRLPAPSRGQRLLLRLRGADQRGQARGGGPATVRSPLTNGDLEVEVGDDGVGGARPPRRERAARPRRPRRPRSTGRSTSKPAGRRDASAGHDPPAIARRGSLSGPRGRRGPAKVKVLGPLKPLPPTWA